MKSDTSTFLRITGYGRSDILARNNTTRIFLTRNGGKYKLKNGTVKHLAGPAINVEDRD